MNSTHNFLFISDFHISEGRDLQTGLTQRNEDFFHDDAFARFIIHHAQMGDKPWKLIINGDLFDFLQVTSLPDEDELGQVIKKRALTENEKKYGLGTSEAATIWKLQKIAAGHPLFFQALAWFVAHPQYELVLLKGNHDIELLWPGVQKGLRTCLVDAYGAWQEHPAVLPQDAGLVDVLTDDMLDTAVSFPPYFYYEENLFFVDHGCQYDPTNAFQDFEKPIITVSNEPVLDLPQGSFFVRYFFNKVEAVHPFADNIKPMSRYIMWLFSNAPTQGIRFVFTILPDYVRTLRQMRRKNVKKVIKYVKIAPDGHTHPTEFWEAYQKIQAKSREGLSKVGKSTTLKVIGALALLGVAFVFLLTFVRMIAVGNWGLSLLAFAAIVFSLLGTVVLFNALDQVLATTYLYRVAEDVAALLNRRPGSKFGPVRYLILGHDHVARSWQLETGDVEHKPTFRQWYINTGSWIPVFSEVDQLERPSANLTFFRIIPNQINDAEYGDVPQLLRWSLEQNQPVPVRLFAQ